MILKLYKILLLLFLMFSSSYSYVHKPSTSLARPSLSQISSHPTLSSNLRSVAVIVGKKKEEVKKEVKKDEKKKKCGLLCNLSKIEKKVEKDVQNVVNTVQKVEKKIQKTIMTSRDVQYAISLFKKGKEFAEEEWLETKQATKTMNKILSHIGKVTNVISIAVDDLVECPRCSIKCNVCRIGVDELLNMGEFDTCGIIVPSVCQIIGLGPEDPLSDLCSVGMGMVCSKLEDRLEKMASPKRLCQDIHMCK